MKKKTEKQTAGDELRKEYDLSKLKGGVRGKYIARFSSGNQLGTALPGRRQAFP